jgi:hypothetical protein
MATDSDRDKFQQTVVERLFWNTAERDDATVAEHLFRNKQMDKVYTLDEATLFDFFFQYLREIGAFELLEGLEPEHCQRKSVPFLQFVLVFLMKAVGSIPRMDPVHDLILTDELLMGLCGFNGYQVRNGTCQRGVARRKPPAPEIRGAICVDTLADQVTKIAPEPMEELFNGFVRCLAQQSLFPKYIHAVCDATDYETTERYEGRGVVLRKRKVRARGARKNGELKTVDVLIYGWKVWAVYEINSGIPLAIKIDTIEKPDNLHVLSVLEQAKVNVAATSTIRSLVIDRGFLDGKVLYAIDRQGIEFVIPLKRNMEATRDARQLALDHETCYPACRSVEVAHGQGRNRWMQTVLTELVGVEGLLTCDWFNPRGSDAYTSNRDYEPVALNAVVIKTWDNKTPPVDKQVVYVTNGDVRDPFVAFDRYDDRSLIENNLFKDTKQNWHLLHPPKKSERGVIVQVYLVMAMKAATSAFLIWQQEQMRLHELGEETTWNMYRRRLKMLNRNKLIVFARLHYGIYLSHEVFMLAGVPVTDIEKELNITRDSIYTKYTGQPPPDSS